MGHPAAHIVTLPDPLNTRYTTYENSEEQLVITLLPPIVEGGIVTRMNEKGKKSLEWILESRARHACVVHWPAGALDATYLPHLPVTVKKLTLCGMAKFLNNTVPSKGYCNHQHWIHTFAARLRNLETLTLSGCDYRPEDLPRLRGWSDSLDIKVEEREN